MLQHEHIQSAMKGDSMDVTAKDTAMDETYARHRNKVYICPEGGQELIAEYDEFSGLYNKLTDRNGYVGYKRLVDALCHYVTCKSHHILDVASGTGLVGKELKMRGYTNIDAFDPSQKSLDLSRELDAYNEYMCDTMRADRATKIPDDHYDAVVIAGAFGLPGHIDESCFPEIIRIIKPGGYFLFSISDKVLQEHKWANKLESALDAVTKTGLWELVEIRIDDHITLKEKAKIPVLKILKM